MSPPALFLPRQLPSLPDLQNLAQGVNPSIMSVSVFIHPFLCVKYYALCFMFIVMCDPLAYSKMLLLLSFTCNKAEV